MFENAQQIRKEDRPIGRIILIWVSIATAIFVGVVILLMSHFINTNNFENAKSESESDNGNVAVKIDRSWYADKPQFDVLPTLSSLPSEFTAYDVLFTREYQYSRSLGRVSLSDIQDELESVGGQFQPASVVFTGIKGEKLVAFRSEYVYLVFSYTKGLVALGTTAEEDLDKLSALYGGESRSLVDEGYVNTYETSLWVFYYTNDIKLNEEAMKNEF